MKPPLRSTIDRSMSWLHVQAARLPWPTRVGFRCLPSRCLFCDGEGELRYIDLCADCLGTLPWARAIEEFRQLPCGVTAHAAFDYRSPVADSLKSLKFHGDRRVAKVFGALLAAAISAAGESDTEGRPEVILPVPLHHHRHASRGLNQSLLIAREVGRWLRLPVRRDGLIRLRATPPQTGLHAGERRQNVAGAFLMQPRLHADIRRAGLRRIVLIDDVLTTGSTLDAAATALLQGGVRELQCWSVARAMPTNTTSPT